MANAPEGMLSPYRVLDLTDEKGSICAKLLGDFGADVIKIEPPGGDPARRFGPFFHDQPHPEKSLSWLAFNLNKRGITLNIKSKDGREIFKRLVKSSDFVIESFPTGYVDTLGLGYSDLEKLNPGVIMVSITPFGQSGPYRDYKSSDIVAWALGGHLYQGDADRPPVGVSEHTQSYLHAGAEAAAAALMALYYRRLTKEGQQISVSIQECIAGLNVPSTAWWAQKKAFAAARSGERVNPAGNVIHPKLIWACKDGWVSCQLSGGPLALRVNLPLMEWMNDEGMLDDFLKTFDWLAFSFDTTTQEVIERINEPITRFLKSHTMAELLEGAIRRGVMLYPIGTIADIANNSQLASRNFWFRIEHPEMGATITYPGAFIKSSEAPPKIQRRAPLIGEHNQEIYEQELGISKAELIILSGAGVI